MPTPHYVAKRIGDEYVLQRTDPAGAAADLLWLTAGGAMAACGILRGGTLGWAAAFVGGSMICRGVTGKNPFARLINTPASPPVRDDADEPGPSHPHDQRPTSQAPADAVDEASMQSFPSSDPPARTATATPTTPTRAV